jgi:hypothetical protein
MQCHHPRKRMIQLSQQVMLIFPVCGYWVPAFAGMTENEKVRLEIMSIYTVHEPPLRAGAAAPEPERYAFVRDGFSFWALLFAPLWMLRHRMWLVLVLYLVISVGLEIFIHVAGASAFIVGLVAFLISFLVGFEAGTLRRFTLRRRGWTYVGVVSGEDVEAAERRFFDTWLRRGAQAGAPAAAAPAVPNPHMSQPVDVIGLFPEPGATR